MVRKFIDLLVVGFLSIYMNRLLAVSVLIGTTILTLLGGLALVARSLRNVDLTLFLELKKDDRY